MAAREAMIQAPARIIGEWDSSAEGASDLESSGVGASLAERVLALLEWIGVTPMQDGGATGSVSDQISRLVLWPRKPGAGLVATN